MKLFATRHPLPKKTADEDRNRAKLLHLIIFNRRYFWEQPI
jgi:hypothetical protein